jgi:hypothetical protein
MAEPTSVAEIVAGLQGATGDYLTNLSAILDELVSTGVWSEEYAGTFYKVAKQKHDSIMATYNTAKENYEVEAAKASEAGEDPPTAPTLHLEFLPLYTTVQTPNARARFVEKQALESWEQKAKAKGALSKKEEQASINKMVAQLQTQQGRDLEEHYGRLREQQAAGGVSSEMIDIARAQGQEEPTPQMPDLSPFVYNLLDKLPPNVREYARGQLPEVLGRFQADFPDVRKAWWRALNQPTDEDVWEEEEEALARGVSVRRKGLTGAERGIGDEAAGMVSPRLGAFPGAAQSAQQAYAKLLGERRGVPEARAGLESALSEYEQFLGTDAGREEAPRKPARDPLAAYLEQYPWAEEFKGLSPRRRGLYPARVAPPARWY